MNKDNKKEQKKWVYCVVGVNDRLVYKDFTTPTNAKREIKKLGEVGVFSKKSETDRQLVLKAYP